MPDTYKASQLAQMDKRLRTQEAKALGPTLGEAYAQFTAIPGLRGFWPMSSHDEFGDAIDLSGQGRTAYVIGEPTYHQYNSLVPYVELDGVNDALNRPIEFGLQITGLEAFVNSAVRGLTVGGWFWTDDTPGGTEQHVCLKGGTSATSKFDLYTDASLASVFNVYNGASLTQASLAASMSVAAWHWQVGRFTPSNEVALFTDSVKTTTATAFASLNSPARDFTIGAQNAGGGGLWMDGRAALVFYSDNVLSDAYINLLYNRSRVLFGV